MKYLLIFFALIVVLSFISPKTTSAQFFEPVNRCVGNAGSTFCVGPPDWQEQIKRVTCEGGEEDAGFCPIPEDQICRNGGCQTLYRTRIYVEPATPQLGEDVEVTVTSTKTCLPDLKLDPGPGLHDRDNFKLPECQREGPFCDGNSKDKLRCYFKYKCIGYRLSDRLSNGEHTEFKATTTSSASSECTHEVLYPVIEPPECVQDKNTTVVDQYGSKDQELVAPTFDFDKVINKVQLQANIPTEIRAELGDPTLPTITPIPTPPLPEIGVDVSFNISSFIRRLLCENPVVLFLGAAHRFCPIPVNLSEKTTEYQVNVAETLINSKRPPEITPIPAPKSCYLAEDQDLVTALRSGSKTLDDLIDRIKGNRLLNKIDTSLGTTIGKYKMSHPEIPDAEPDIDQYNVSIYQKVVTGDQRIPDVNCARAIDFKAKYPDGTYPDLIANGCVQKDITTP